jgi:hypothetical protein
LTPAIVFLVNIYEHPNLFKDTFEVLHLPTIAS